MIIFFLVGAIVAAFGVFTGHLSYASLGTGLFILSGAALSNEKWWQEARGTAINFIKLVRLRRLLANHLNEIERASGLCEVFAEHFPNYIRLPFILDEQNKVQLAPCAMERAQVSRNLIPEPINDLATILASQGISFADVLLLALVVNREVMRFTKERIRLEVIEVGGEPFSDDLRKICLRYVVWEQAQVQLNGGKSLHYREALTDLFREHYTFREIKGILGANSARTMTQVIDYGITSAQEGMTRKKRAVRLQAALVDEPAQERNTGQQPTLLTVSALSQLAKHDVLAATRTLREVFLQGQDSHYIDQSDCEQGFFLANSGSQRVLFQLGCGNDGILTKSAVEHALGNKMKMGADKVILIALDHVDTQVLLEADALHVLVLPPEALDRLLSYYTDRMWQTVEWSLRVSARQSVADQKENHPIGLELGLST